MALRSTSGIQRERSERGDESESGLVFSVTIPETQRPSNQRAERWLVIGDKSIKSGEQWPPKVVFTMASRVQRTEWVVLDQLDLTDILHEVMSNDGPAKLLQAF